MGIYLLPNTMRFRSIILILVVLTINERCTLINVDGSDCSRVFMFMSVIMLFVDLTSAIKWWCLFLIVLGTFAMCVPDELVNEDFDKAIRRAPLMAIKMVLNVFRLRGLKNKFLHTEHSITTVDK